MRSPKLCESEITPTTKHPARVWWPVCIIPLHMADQNAFADAGFISVAAYGEPASRHVSALDAGKARAVPDPPASSSIDLSLRNRCHGHRRKNHVHETWYSLPAAYRAPSGSVSQQQRCRLGVQAASREQICTSVVCRLLRLRVTDVVPHLFQRSPRVC